MLSCPNAYGKYGNVCANSVDSDRTPRSTASDLNLHCLLRTRNTESDQGLHFPRSFWTRKMDLFHILGQI